MSGYVAGGLLDTISDDVRLEGGIDMHAIRQEPGSGRSTAEERDMDPIAYREVVVHRLLDRGVKASTLAALLPDWHDLILGVAADLDTD